LKYAAHFGEGAAARSRAIEIPREAAGPKVDVVLDGSNALWEVSPMPGGGYSLVGPDSRHAEATVHHLPDGRLRVHVGGDVFDFDFLDELTARAQQAAGGKGKKKSSDVKAAIPGRVIRILVKSGDVVAAAQPLLVLEAMKMENDVRSPRDGTIRSVEVTAGQAVGAGDLLIRFVPES
jgi:acetyl/propionyl-CoA carboxylase alpha subunit